MIVAAPPRRQVLPVGVGSKIRALEERVAVDDVAGIAANVIRVYATHDVIVARRTDERHNFPFQKVGSYRTVILPKQPGRRSDAQSKGNFRIFMYFRAI